MVAADRNHLHQVIDDLSPESLEKLTTFIDYLLFIEKHHKPSWLKEIYDTFEPVRQAVAASGMSEDEVNQLIDEAIDEVRREPKS